MLLIYMVLYLVGDSRFLLFCVQNWTKVCVFVIEYVNYFLSRDMNA